MAYGETGTRTKHGADKVVKKLESSGIAAAAIHGNKSQPQREKVLAQFRDGSCRVLIATDIAARGIDIPDVSHVFNYELPNVPESYVHRIGRTARAGRAGIAISLCDGEERAYLRSIERLTRLSVPVLRIDGVAAPTAKELMEEVASPSTQRQQRPPRRDGTDPRRSSRPQGNGNRANSDRRAAPAAKPAASKPAGSKPAHAGAKPRGMSWSRAEIAGLQGRQRPRPN